MARKRKQKVTIDIEAKDFTINDSCIICEVKTDGSVLCDKCFEGTLKLRKNLKKKIKNRGVA